MLLDSSGGTDGLLMYFYMVTPPFKRLSCRKATVRLQGCASIQADSSLLSKGVLVVKGVYENTIHSVIIFSLKHSFF